MTVTTIEKYANRIVVRVDNPGGLAVELHFDGKRRTYFYEGWGLQVPPKHHSAIDDDVRAYLESLT